MCTASMLTHANTMQRLSQGDCQHRLHGSAVCTPRTRIVTTLPRASLPNIGNKPDTATAALLLTKYQKWHAGEGLVAAQPLLAQCSNAA